MSREQAKKQTESKVAKEDVKRVVKAVVGKVMDRDAVQKGPH